MSYMIKDYLTAVGDSAERVFKEAVKRKCTHVSTGSWDEMVSKRTINCNGSGSIALQLAGCLDKGVRMGHVSTKGIDESQITSIDKAMYNRDKIRHCRFVWVGGCKYKDLPYWLKQRGVIYIQWSNCCTSAGDGWIWSCNEEGGYNKQPDGSKRYDQYKGGVLTHSGHYPRNGIIFVCIVPEVKWDQHWAVEVMLEKHGTQETRKDHFGSHSDTIQKIVNRMCRNHKYFCWWSADYILERYGTISDFYKPGHFDYRAEVQDAINEICKDAREVWAGKHGGEEQRKKDFGEDWYEFVQRQVNRTTKTKS